MKILIVYHYRLGDIIRMFPIARALAAAGLDVFIECRPQYWGIFGAISYAKPVPPGAAAAMEWSQVFRPQIWPERYDAFRQSGLTWMDFIYGLYPEWLGLDRRIVFDRLDTFPLAQLVEDYQLPERYQAIFPFSHSSKPVAIERIFQLAAEVANLDEERALLFMESKQKAELETQGFIGTQIRCVEKLADLPAIIAHADAVLTVNTSTTIIASAVRHPDRELARYFHVRESNHQDNWTSPNQTVLLP